MITKEDIEYIKYVYDNRQRYIKPDVKRIIRAYNILMNDGKHIFHPVSEQICACSLSPYLLQLYRKMESIGMFKDESNEEKPVESTPKPPKKKGSRKK